MPKAEQSHMRTIWLTILALVAFAANSLLCRLALSRPSIDAASFSLIRVLSGAMTLWLIVVLTRSKSNEPHGGNWLSASLLLLYVVGFSFAYLSLSTGTGALILFGTVQATMLFAAIMSGERLYFVEWFGLLLAIFGLVYLISPGLTAPPFMESAFMAIAGAAWGIYSLRGRNTTKPLAATAGNFIRAVPLALLVFLASLKHIQISTEGILLAVTSGALASGIGYTIWYAALRGLSRSRAATLQLTVPMLAAIGGIFLLSEALSLRLLLSAIMILGGVALALLGREYTTQ